MMYSWATGSLQRTTLYPRGYLALASPWMFFMEIRFVGKATTNQWTISSLTTYITLTCWVLAERRQGLMKCLAAPNRSLSIKLLPLHHLLEWSQILCSLSMLSSSSESEKILIRDRTGIVLRVYKFLMTRKNMFSSCLVWICYAQA